MYVVPETTFENYFLSFAQCSVFQILAIRHPRLQAQKFKSTFEMRKCVLYEYNHIAYMGMCCICHMTYLLSGGAQKMLY